MKTRYWFAVCMLVVIFPSASLCEQVVDVKNCVYREGDDPQWARPEYNDSDWAGTFSDPSQHLPKTRFLWQRCHVDASRLAGSMEATAPLFLQLRLPFAWQVFVDGIAAGSFGNLKTGSVTLDLMQQIRIPPELRARPSWLVATRMIRANPTFSIVALSPNPAAGTGEALQLRRFRAIEHELAARWLPSVMAPLIFAAAMLLLVLWRANPNRREVLWLGLMAGGFALKRTVDLLVTLQLALPSNAALVLLTLGNLGMDTAPWLFYSLRSKPVPKVFLPLYLAGTLFDPTWNIPVSGTATYFLFSLSQHPAFQLIGLALLAVLWYPAIAAYWPFGKLKRADLILFVTGLIWMLSFWITLALQLPGIPIELLPLARQVQTLGFIPALLVFILVLASQFRRVHGERDDLTADMQAARVVQRRLVPERIPPIAGFESRAAYLPAKEVGGDFYRIFAAEDGAILVIIGDVSGKGLSAAMTVSVLVGGMEAIRTRMPGEFLAELNKVAHAHLESGFVTCCAALIGRTGEALIANAGHPAPYLDRLEVETEAGLPLGLLRDINYGESKVRGDRFMFISDGVLEAANARGELFGFDRTLGISGDSAQEIAEAAKAWGQNDDITVVTIQRIASSDVRRAA